MKFAKDPIDTAKTKRRPVMGRLRGFARLMLALLVIFVSAHSSSSSRIRWASPSSSTVSFEKRQPFIPATTHLLRTSFVSIDEKNDYSWFVADKVCAAVWPVVIVKAGTYLKTFDSEDPPDSFLVLPLRI